MRQLHLPINRTLYFFLLTAFFWCCPVPGARADVVGRLNVTVSDADTTKPIQNATVTFVDSAGVHPDFTMTTGPNGSVLSPELEIRSWEIDTAADGYNDDSRSVTVSADTTTNVPIAIAAKKEQVIKIVGARQLIRKSQTAAANHITSTEIQKYPATGGNSQSMTRMLLVNPGFVQSSNGVDHPRGEHASTTIDIDGAEMPGALMGRGGQLLSPEVIQSADILTGAYAPEYGSEAAAVLNFNLKSGPIEPFESFSAQGGGFSTYNGDLTFGGQGGDPLLTNETSGPVPRKLRYFVDINDRSTANAVEPPQPDNQTAHNAQTSATLFSKFDYQPNLRDQFGLMLSSAPANTEIANRTGLPGKYAPIGQGYGFGGARDGNGVEPVDPTTPPGLLGEAPEVLPSQQAAGQDIYQVDNNSFGLMNYRHEFNPTTTGLMSVSTSASSLQLKNNSPAINLQSFNPDGTLSTIDNSIEYNPNMSRSYQQNQIQGSVTESRVGHTFKEGFVFDDQTGNESYQFVPQSQLALDELYATDPNLAPAGKVDTNAQGKPVLDVLNNPVFLMNPGQTTSPIVTVHRTGYYGAAYLQDTWTVTQRFTVNYGVRYDVYHQKQTSNLENPSNITQSYLSPRLNMAYALSPTLLGRLSYNKLFTQPPLAQGATLGQAIKPETINQYDASVEKQLSPTQVMKLAYYYKDIRNQDDTGILLPFTQIGAYTTLNYQYASIHGIEYSYNVLPKNNVGTGGYVAFANSMAKPGGTSTVAPGATAPPVNDHDQRNTISTGLSYTWKNQAFAGVDYYYGSGESSSVLAAISAASPLPGVPGANGPANDSAVLNDGKRNPHSWVNLRVASSPTMIGGVAGLELDVENLFDQRDVLNFNSGFSGTRFEQGRNVLLSISGKF